MSTPSEIGTSAKTYLAAIGASAIFVARDHGKPINVGVARDLDKALRQLRRLFSPSVEFGWVAWAVNYGALVDIAQGIKPSLPLLELVVAIEAAAQQRGLVLTPHTRALERAAVYAGYLDQALEVMQSNGTFSAFNRAYKAHRETAARLGGTVQPFWAVMQELRAVIIRSLVAEPKNRLMPASVIIEIRQQFPWFVKPVLLAQRPKRRKRR